MIINLGFTASHDQGLRRLLGKPLTDPQTAVLGRLWSEVANPGETARLTDRGIAERL